MELWDLLEYTKLYEFSNHITISEDRGKDEGHAQLPDHWLCSFVKNKLRVGSKLCTYMLMHIRCSCKLDFNFISLYLFLKDYMYFMYNTEIILTSLREQQVVTVPCWYRKSSLGQALNVKHLYDRQWHTKILHHACIFAPWMHICLG